MGTALRLLSIFTSICGMRIIANGILLDCLRRIRCLVFFCLIWIFVKKAFVILRLSEITRYIGLGDYSQWMEDDKQAF